MLTKVNFVISKTTDKGIDFCGIIAQGFVLEGVNENWLVVNEKSGKFCYASVEVATLY